MRKASVRSLTLLTAAALVVPGAALLLTASPGVAANPEMSAARKAAPVILTGAQLPGWSQLPATGVAAPYPSGVQQVQPSPPRADALRSAHNGTLVAPPANARTGIDPNRLAAYSWTAAAGWHEVPVQVDQKFPYFLANGHSTFSVYSGTDEELTYAWAPDRHSTGEESWKKVFGDCTARYATPPENAALPAIGSRANANQEPAGSGDELGVGPGYTAAMQDPVPQLDDDDEVVFMARDAGDVAPTGTPGPAGVDPAGQSVQVLDPLEPNVSRVVYLFLKSGGSSFNASTGYVQMTRAADADTFIDRDSFAEASPEFLGRSNKNYGPNIGGTVCKNVDSTAPVPRVSTVDADSPKVGDRFPSDAMTVTTPTYKLGATGRWMVRSMQIKHPTTGAYGPNLLSRWKGRAFQQSPDSSVSLVGFEDEQVNWEANGALLGWRNGPVRAIREIWGADSGTNVTKTETYYRDADTYSYHVRVHPIPSDGLYTSWDYNPANVSTYYNLVKSQDQPPLSAPVPVTGVPIDGVNDDTGSVDKVPVANQPAYFDVPDPTFDAVSAINRPEEVAGPNGGMVYEFEFTGATSALNAAAVPYYRDDQCLDDGTGDIPFPRPFPGDSYTDNGGRVAKAYVDRAISRGAPSTLTIDELKAECMKYAGAATWAQRPFTAAFGQHGIHFFTTHDSDNATLPKPVTEIVGQQWRFSIPMAKAENHVLEYGNNVSVKLQGFAQPYTAGGPTTTTTPSPAPTDSPTPSVSPTGTASPTASPTGTASPTVTPSTSATPTATTSPSPTKAAKVQLTLSVSPSEITPGPASTVTVHGSPNSRVQLMAYSRPSSTYRVARDDTTDANGDITWQVTPGTNTRLYATYGDGTSTTDSPSRVIAVHTTLSVSGIRTGIRQYDFHGRDLPRRSGQLITLYRVDAAGNEIRTASVHSDSSGTWQLNRSFAGSGTFRFLVRTSQNLTNADGRSNVITVSVH